MMIFAFSRVRSMLIFLASFFLLCLWQTNPLPAQEPPNPTAVNDCLTLQDMELQLSACNLAIESDPTYTDLYYVRARIYLAQGEIQPAIDDYSRVITWQPDFVPALVERGAVYAYLENYTDAIADLSQALEIAPLNQQARMFRASAYVAVGDEENALNDLDVLLELDPNNLRSLLERGTIRAIQHEFELAIEDFTAFIDALEVNGTSASLLIATARSLGMVATDVANAYHIRGTSFLATNQFERAESDLTRALELFPNEPVTLTNRGVARLALREFEAANLDFTVAIELSDGQYGRSYLGRSLVRLLSEDQEGAREDAANYMPFLVEAAHESALFEGSTPTSFQYTPEELRIYVFSIKESGRYSLRAEAVSESLSPFVIIVDVDGNVVDLALDNNPNLEAINLTQMLDIGTYYVYVMFLDSNFTTTPTGFMMTLSAVD